MSWQPIETAPKDGAAILVYGRNSFACEPYMGVRQWFSWPSGGGVWAEPNISAHDLDDWLDDEITHWMPLPQPPAQEGT